MIYDGLPYFEPYGTAEEETLGGLMFKYLPFLILKYYELILND